MWILMRGNRAHNSRWKQEAMTPLSGTALFTRRLIKGVEFQRMLTFPIITASHMWAKQQPNMERYPVSSPLPHISAELKGTGYSCLEFIDRHRMDYHRFGLIKIHGHNHRAVSAWMATHGINQGYSGAREAYESVRASLKQGCVSICACPCTRGAHSQRLLLITSGTAE